MRPRFTLLSSVARPLLAATALLLATGEIAAQRIPSTKTPITRTPTTKTIDSAFIRFGKVTSVKAMSGAGLIATATKQYKTPQGALGWGSHTVTYQVNPHDFSPPLQVVPGIPVDRSLDGKRVRFVRFPILLESTGQVTVGKGTGKGRFWMEAKNLMLSLPETGAEAFLSAQIQLQSEDVINGFSGEMWVRILDKNEPAQEVIQTIRAGCWGVNMRSGRTLTWSVSLPRPQVATARKVEVLFGNACRNSWSAAMGYVKTAGEAIGPWAEAYAKTQGGSPAPIP